ncbi:hypothetical protein [Paracoccus seriniphilus]|uniref:Uncharacterized protein n=1 Tax=Paracoccus seriniphilus TaxID=184748 RepID=A0A239Q3B6_9RHOB|nr:hypothetical protein [Paracoccus seriniphilus]WCR13236.1 hypothetical protein JHW44_09810 [Paracoccus seriniphilus]SNT76437.1 hypothetical protein SAMN05444959_1203 [Paracoccus seriniphilus]
MTVRLSGFKSSRLPCVVKGNEHITEDDCRELWCAVLAEAWREAFTTSTTATPRDIAVARRWFGSRDFHTVCALAGLDGDYVMCGFRAAVRGDRPKDVGFNPRGTGPVPKVWVAA